MIKSINARELPRLILSIMICQAAGIIGSIFTSSSVSTWYTTLTKPEFTPPGSVISAVWLILFTLMGISLFLIWREGSSRQEVKSSLFIFAAQLIVNVLWSGAFFGLRSPSAGIIAIAVLWALILLTIVKFWPISRAAALLLVPYILWVSFAAFLNFSIWRLNS
ncbi:MAG TPA: TspO/MBR family protein [Methanotrichaceae archaeon]|nr:TspO/MBR family protein [Methanotrichaceae archaeon]